MSNANTIRRQVAGTQQLTIAPITSAAIGAVPTAFQLNNNGLTLAGGGVIPLAAGTTGLWLGTGAVIHVRANGTVSSTLADVDLVLSLYEVPASEIVAGVVATAVTFTNWHLIGASSVAVVDTLSPSFTFDAYLQLGATGRLDGSFTADVDGVLTSLVAITTPVTGLTEADLNFVMVATLSTTTTAGTTVTLNEFAIDAV